MSNAYGSWRSPVTPSHVAASGIEISELRTNDSHWYWLELRPLEGGRSTIVRLESSGAVKEVIPQELSARSRVHEYGGGSYCLNDAHLWLVDARDQNIYQVSLDDPNECECLTSGDDSERFADLQEDRRRERLIAIREFHRAEGEPVNDLVAIDTGAGSIAVLAEGHDFYMSPALSGDGARLAYVAWDHPNMPWDGSYLYVAEVLDDGRLGNSRVLAGGENESIVQPTWGANGALLYLSDKHGFWNLFGTDSDLEVCPLLLKPAEYGGPAWVFGLRSFGVCEDGTVLAARTRDGTTDLVSVDSTSHSERSIHAGCSGYGSVFGRSQSGQRTATCIAGSSTTPPFVLTINAETGRSSVVHQCVSSPFAKEWISIGEPIQFPSSDGDLAHAYFYVPTNPGIEQRPEGAPPLLVLTHGGPTSRHDNSLSLAIQAYTSRGWAVLDVNYGGSTGYGRRYRERLEGNWGIVDVADCEAGVRHLVEMSKADPTRVAIKGGSAGGYTTLQALTTSEVFKAGASYYGIGDLALLDADTHKFESRYLERLVSREHFQSRSPVNQIEQLTCPVIFFQGAEDRVVPPNQARMMFKALAARGVPTALFIFEREGHGFRDARSRETAIEAEIVFLSRVFGLEAPGLSQDIFESAEVANLS